MADRTLTFSPNKTSISMTTSWGIFQTPGSSTDTTHTALTGGSATVSFAISGITLGANENIKKIVLTSTRSNSGTIDGSARLTMNGVNYSAAKRLDAELTNGTNFEIDFFLMATGKAGSPGTYIAPNFYSMTTTISNMVLTVTIGEGSAFNGEISSLNEGDKIIITEASGNGTYTLIQHEYNTGKAMLFRDASVGTSKYYNSAPSSYVNNKFESSTLDTYINTTWYGGLPTATKNFLTTLNYPIAQNNNSTATTISRNASTISDTEHGGGTGSTSGEKWGIPVSYTGTLSLSTPYWTRTPISGMNNYAKIINTSNNTANSSVTTAQNVRPTLGVLETQLVKPTTNGYIFCTKCTAPTTVKINNGTTNITNTQPNTSCTLSWSGAAAGTNAPITGYAVWYSTSANGTYSLYGTTTSTSMSVSGPEKGFSTYYFKVQTLSEEEIDYCNSNLSSTSRAISTKKSNLYYYDGTRWLIGLPKYWNGSAWVEGNSTNYYNGSSWKKPT